MNNSEVSQFFCKHKSYSYRSIADQFITSFGFEQSDMNLFRLKFNEIQKERNLFTKNSEIDTWNSMYFSHIPKMPKLHFYQKLWRKPQHHKKKTYWWSNH